MFKKRVLSLAMAATLLVSSVFTGGTATVSAAASKSSEATNQWQAVAFGQSVDVNFSSTILPEKVGTNNVFEKGTNVKLPVQVPTALQDVTIESRGGKIQTGHDGLTFYYTEVPTSKNFVLTGTVTVEQLGPENGTAANLQEGCGLMVRDVIGGARQEPLMTGYEEYPAASNMAAIWIDAVGKSKGADLDIQALARYGVDEKAGSATAVRKAKRTNWMNALDLRQTTDANKNTYNAKMTLQLERTNETFIMRLLDEDGSVSKEYNFKNDLDSNINANIVQNIENDTMYVGFYAARNAKMSVENVSLTLTEANTVDAPQYKAVNSEAAVLYQASSNYANSTDYKVQALSNYDGTMTVKKDNQVVAEGLAVKAGEQFVYPTTLENDTTNFTLEFTADPSIDTTGNKSASVSFTVTKEAYANDLYVSPTGTALATGTEEDPMDLATAIDKLVPGGNIYMAGGTYSAVNITLKNSGNKDARKSLIPTGKVVIKDSKIEYLFKLDSDYWNISNLEVDGEDRVGSRGFYVYGSHNVMDKLDVHNTKSDAGFCLTKGGRGSRVLWPSYNVVKNTESYNHVDVSSINADGFASKSGSGDYNQFINCVSHDNADDGWDLYNTLSGGKNGSTIIENCIAYNNGNNGFKLGGESLAVKHEIRNSVAYNNGLDGFTDNFNPGELLVENNTSYDNTRFNFIFRPSPYVKDANGNMTAAGTFINNVSYRTTFTNEDGSAKYDDKVYGLLKENNYFIENSKTNIKKVDFASLNKNNAFYRTKDGEIAFGDFLRLSPISKLNYAGKDGSHVGALKATVILVDNIDVTSDKTTLEVGQTTTLTATVAPTTAENKDITWVSKDSSVATVDEFGKVTAVKAGTTIIKAIAKDGSKVSESIAITVVNKPVVTPDPTPVPTTKPTPAPTVKPTPAPTTTPAPAVTKPAKVTGVKVTSQTTSTVKLSWKKATGATSYEVYVYNTKAKKYEKATTVKATSATVSKVGGKKLVAGTNYKFYVVSVKKANNTTVKATKSSVIIGTTKPAKVSLTVKAGTKKANLSWKKVTGATGYQVYQYNAKAKKYVKVKTLTKGTTVKWTDTKEKKGSTVKYKVRAYKKSNGKTVYGDFSAVKSVKIK